MDRKHLIIIGFVLVVVVSAVGLLLYSGVLNEEGKSNLCLKENSCKFRTPGSGFRCDADRNYDETEDYWCECTNDCKVKIL